MRSRGRPEDRVISPQRRDMYSKPLWSNLIFVSDVIEWGIGRRVAVWVLISICNSFSHNNRETMVFKVRRGGRLSFRARDIASIIGGRDLGISPIHGSIGREVRGTMP